MTSNEKNTAALIHLSTLSQYFFPFGNFIFPIVIWSSKKSSSEFIDYNGKQVLNFQLSMFLYSLLLVFISVPILIYTIFKNVSMHAAINDESFVFDHFSAHNITGVVILAVIGILILAFLKLMEFFLIIYASVKTSNGEQYKYPLTIPFFK